ncbi:STE3-domain-containing protein [Wolfiporia cocos MD-104 SS10]|uniref:STE3-domain-containing protein n=9 Tax=Wolfiporia cocos TaxID=81056 RepID=A0A2H3JE79_WOLCO|nr:STE3-domain-containing protein [Wolfiporia cocos MD-104 SS10]
MDSSWAVQENVVIAFSFIGFVLVNIPLYWHLEAWNIGCIMYIFWSGSQCLIQFINAVVWRNNVINWAPVWCDITSRYMLAASVGIITASLLINRRLYHIANITTIHIDAKDRRRMIIIDVSIGLGLPILQVLVYWFIQGHRFDIFEGFGCFYAIPNTILSWFLCDIWPIVIGCVSAVYCTLTIRAFLRRRKQLRELVAANKNLNFNRYFRLMAIAVVEVCLTVPLGIYTMVQNATGYIYPWAGLANLHYQFSAVDQIPAILWRADPQVAGGLAFTQWSFIGTALVFFALFGLAAEARKHYHDAYVAVCSRVGVRTDFYTGLSSRLGMSSRLGLGRPWKSFVDSFSKSKSVIATPIVTIDTFIQKSRPDTIHSFSDRLSVSISLTDVGSAHSIKLASPASYSSTCVADSPTDEKSLSIRERCDAPLPSLPSVDLDPEFVLDISREAMERPLPDVPMSVRHSVDIV